MKNLKPTVSIQTTAHNDEPTIQRCIESILAQKNSFTVEHIVGIDQSIDQTYEIVKTYADRYPKQIKILLSDRVIGQQENDKRCQSAATGKYIAFCDGADYWSDPLKLQKQVDLLEANPTLIGVATNFSIADKKGRIICPKALSLSQMEKNRHGIPVICTPQPVTVVYRRIPSVPYYIHAFGQFSNHEDAYAHLMRQFGDIAYLDDISGVHTLKIGPNPQPASKRVSKRLRSHFDMQAICLELGFKMPSNYVNPVQLEQYFIALYKTVTPLQRTVVLNSISKYSKYLQYASSIHKAS